MASIEIGPDDCAIIVRNGTTPEICMPKKDEDEAASEAQMFVLGVAICLEDPLKKQWIIDMAKSHGES